MSGWLVSLCLHEYAHARGRPTAAGDRDVADRGYLTLNPLKYTHPLLSIVLPVVVVLLGGIGLPGGAVWVDRTPSAAGCGTRLISLAGPATNVLFTLVLVVPFVGCGVGTSTSGGPVEFWAGLALLAFLQLTASVLNLLPVPGLDGGNMIQPWLQPAVAADVRPVRPVRLHPALRAAVAARGSAAGSSTRSSPSATCSACRRALRHRPRPDPLLAELTPLLAASPAPPTGQCRLLTSRQR